MNVDDEHVGGREEHHGDRDSGRWDEGQWDRGDRDDHFDTDPAYHSRVSDYFQLLAISNERSTGISGSSTSHDEWNNGDGTHRRSTTIPTADDVNNAFPRDKMAQGYFKSFFQEEYRLGMGANGSVFLCQVHICCFFFFPFALTIFGYSMY